MVIKADAFRHALLSYKMTKKVGSHIAKRLTDSYEISVPSNPEDRLMDLFNNNVGRRLAMDPRNKGRKDEEVVMEALNRGELQTRFFRVTPVPGRLPLPPATHPPLGGSGVF